MQRLISAIETVAALFLLLIALVTAGNVTLRGLFAVQIPDWFDGSKLLLGIALFAAAYLILSGYCTPVRGLA